VTDLLEVRGLKVRFGGVRAVDGVDLVVPPGPFGLGLVGESGSGKTTIGRALLHLTPIAEGTIVLDGEDVTRIRGAALKRFRRSVQIVFQDPDGTLDPRMRVGPALSEGLRAHGIVSKEKIPARIDELLHDVGLEPGHARRFPHQLSGGQRQRVAIARALAVEPRLVVLDEPTSALDVTVQSRILRLITGLRDSRQLSYVLISHNLAVVERLCERTAVLYLGRVVEEGPTGRLLARPGHPYTVALRAAVPNIDLTAIRQAVTRPAEPPNAAAPPPGCPFHPRCPLAIDRCRTEPPATRAIDDDRLVACHRAVEVLEGLLDTPS
jgi:oligopeptide/dipeptide ABC transporter ATP-binding protein